jgi:hypothetical protein
VNDQVICPLGMQLQSDLLGFAQIESVPTMGGEFVGTVLTVQKWRKLWIYRGP